jgi:hypothetical protein
VGCQYSNPDARAAWVSHTYPQVSCKTATSRRSWNTVIPKWQKNSSILFCNSYFRAPSDPSGIRSMRTNSCSTFFKLGGMVPHVTTVPLLAAAQRMILYKDWTSVEFSYSLPQEYSLPTRPHPVVLFRRQWTWRRYWNVDGRARHSQWWSCTCRYWFHLSSRTPHACIPYCTIHLSFSGNARFLWLFFDLFYINKFADHIAFEIASSKKKLVYYIAR